MAAKRSSWRVLQQIARVLLLYTAFSSFSSAQLCEPLNIAACRNAGYNMTARFAPVNGTPFQEYSDRIHRLEWSTSSAALGTCSKHSAAIICSLFLPQCVEGRQEPLLPCRSVCRDFAWSCHEKLKLVGLSGLLRGLCELLPEADNNNNKPRRRCFTPEGLNVSSTGGGGGGAKETCHKITLPECRSLRYNYTLLQNRSQEASSVFSLVKPIINSGCSPNATSFYCFTHTPPCFTQNDTVTLHTSCRSFCRKFMKDCDNVFNEKGIKPKPDCEHGIFPDGSSSTGLCTISHWPAPWPSTEGTPTSGSLTGTPTSGSLTGTPTSGSLTGTPTNPHTEMPTSAVTDLTTVPQTTVMSVTASSRGTGSVQAKRARHNKMGIIAGVVVTIVIIIMFALVAFCYYKRHVIKGALASQQLVDMEDVNTPY